MRTRIKIEVTSEGQVTCTPEFNDFRFTLFFILLFILPIIAIPYLWLGNQWEDFSAETEGKRDFIDLYNGTDKLTFDTQQQAREFLDKFHRNRLKKRHEQRKSDINTTAYIH